MGSYLSLNRWSSGKEQETLNGTDQDEHQLNGQENGHDESEQINEESNQILNKRRVRIKECSVVIDKESNAPLKPKIDGDQNNKDDHIITYDEVVSSYEQAHLATNETGVDSTEATFGTLNESEANLTAENVEENDDETKELENNSTNEFSKIKDSNEISLTKDMTVARKSKPIIIVEDVQNMESENDSEKKYICTHPDCTKSYKSKYNLRNHIKKVHENIQNIGQKRIRQLIDTESLGSHSDSAESKSDISSLSDYQGTPKKARKEKAKKKKK